MKILMVTPEITPFAKTGGLGDMVASLSKSLASRGHDVRLVCPFYGCVREWTSKGVWNAHDTPLVVQLGYGHRAYALRHETLLPGSQAKIYFLEYDRYFHRSEIYAGPWGGHSDNHERFAFLSRAAIDLCYSLEWVPDVIHCHDWTTGFVPVYLNTTERTQKLGACASVMTVHNLKHQGIFGREIMGFAGLPDEVFRPDGLECLGNVNMLKGGLYHATKITTVSPTYSHEIQTPEYGHGLDSLLKFRSADLIGILNGIDTDVWDPRTDPFLPAHYEATSLDGKAACKRALQERLGLEQDPNKLIFAAVARLDPQKGLDLLAEAAPWVLDSMHAQIVLLGTGCEELSARFSQLAARYPGRMGVHLGYEAALAHIIEGGADIFVMPSRFEPCGLNQMYSMAYGTPPIVRATGGLLDTVDQYNEATGEGTGFVFGEPSAKALYYTMGWACATYYDRLEHFRKLQSRGMGKDFSWYHSAIEYENFYNWAVQARHSV
ncbi:MAG TPA: glycogen synthase GlgA [Opitutales bacterium]|nr:glycogen synthase GlgA [Opitutales bacterium]